MKPVCVPCQRFFRPVKTGFNFIEAMPTENHAPPGTDDPEKWVPYKLWTGDAWSCEGCGATIVVGVPTHPVAEHYQKDFKETCVRLDARLQVNDC